ncbi:MAG: hypothetical protein WKF58_14410 [Ilumatobacteraceae bacterium]
MTAYLGARLRFVSAEAEQIVFLKVCAIVACRFDAATLEFVGDEARRRVESR